jgi:hypothetical protein
MGNIGKLSWEKCKGKNEEDRNQQKRRKKNINVLCATLCGQLTLILVHRAAMLDADAMKYRPLLASCMN